MYLLTYLLTYKDILFLDSHAYTYTWSTRVYVGGSVVGRSVVYMYNESLETTTLSLEVRMLWTIRNKYPLCKFSCMYPF